MHVANLCFQVFQVFHTYVANVSWGCCICLQWLHMCFQVFLVFYKCFRHMLQVFQLFRMYVASVSSGGCRSRSGVAHVAIGPTCHSRLCSCSGAAKRAQTVPCTCAWEAEGRNWSHMWSGDAGPAWAQPWYRSTDRYPIGRSCASSSFCNCLEIVFSTRGPFKN
jgi:hypothetical protein